MKKVLFVSVVISCLFLSSCVSTNTQRHDSATGGNNEIPMYGNRHTPEQRKMISDMAFEAAGSKEVVREKSNEFAQLGWRFFSEGDLATSIKRFNQSWLLDDGNYQSYWGFALIYLVRDNDVGNANRMFLKAVSLEPDRGNFYVEYGRFTAESNTGSLDEAIALFKTGLDMNPNIRDGYIGLVRAYALKKDVTQIRYWFEEAKKNKVFSAKEIEQYELLVLEVETEFKQ